MLALVIVSLAVVYVAAAGCMFAFVRWLKPIGEYEGEGHVLASLLWPIGLPLIGAFLLMNRTLKGVDERRKAAAKEAADLKAQIAELEREMRSSKAK
jgi:hypothetical protein